MAQARGHRDLFYGSIVRWEFRLNVFVQFLSTLEIAGKSKAYARMFRVTVLKKRIVRHDFRDRSHIEVAQVGRDRKRVVVEWLLQLEERVQHRRQRGLRVTIVRDDRLQPFFQVLRVHTVTNPS